MPDPPSASPSPSPSPLPPSLEPAAEFTAAAIALEPPAPHPGNIFNPVRRRALESSQPCMSQMESLYDAYPTGTSQPLFISSSDSGSLSNHNNVVMGGMVGCIFVLMALTVAGLFVAKRMRRRAIELGDAESLCYDTRRPMQKVDLTIDEKSAGLISSSS
ncbi:hypothetical protein EC991_007030 [Linnemannia zychae]|nr:hypothetical protein EC991_007030 [Linnemannia zychae]